MRDLAVLPVAELHVHLEGAMLVATVRELAERTVIEGIDAWLDEPDV
jgi:adenosine deaminase